MADISQIEHERHENSGRYVIRLDSGETAEMSYVITAPGIRDFNHTYVPEVFRGTGVAARLIKHAIAEARAEGFKLIPTCSYVAAQFARHSDWSDLSA